MKISDHKVSIRPKPARIISDILAFGPVVLIFADTMRFIGTYPELNNAIFRADLIKLWAFPTGAALIFIAYFPIVLTDKKFEKYKITAKNSQSVYDWFAFTVSLCRLPVLAALLDVMTTFQARFAGSDISRFSIMYILYAVVLALMLRVYAHRLKKLTESAQNNTRSKKSDEADGAVKVKVHRVDDDEE